MGVTLPVEGRVGKKCKGPVLAFLSTPVRGSRKGGGVVKKCKGPVLMFSCSHLLPLRRIPEGY